MRNLIFLTLLFPNLCFSQIQGVVEDERFFTKTILSESVEVRIGEIKIGTEGQLITSGLGPCSALAMRYGNKFLLTHVSPADEEIKIVSAINEFIKDIENLDRVEVYVLPGWEMSTLTSSRIFGVLMDTGLIKQAIFFERIANPFDTFGINKHGPIYIKSERRPN